MLIDYSFAFDNLINKFVRCDKLLHLIEQLICWSCVTMHLNLLHKFEITTTCFDVQQPTHGHLVRYYAINQWNANVHWRILWKIWRNKKKIILRALQCHCVLTLNSFEYFILVQYFIVKICSMHVSLLNKYEFN
jgi:hypothetical protein